MTHDNLYDVPADSPVTVVASVIVPLPLVAANASEPDLSAAAPPARWPAAISAALGMP